MLKVYVFTEFSTHTLTGASLKELKRRILDNYNTKGFKFGFDPSGSDSTTFHKLFKGVRV